MSIEKIKTGVPGLNEVLKGGIKVLPGQPPFSLIEKDIGKFK